MDDPTNLAREAGDVIAKLRLRDLNPDEAGRRLQRIADRMEQHAELQQISARLRQAGSQLIAVSAELQQIGESVRARA